MNNYLFCEILFFQKNIKDMFLSQLYLRVPSDLIYLMCSSEECLMMVSIFLARIIILLREIFSVLKAMSSCVNGMSYFSTSFVLCLLFSIQKIDVL